MFCKQKCQKHAFIKIKRIPNLREGEKNVSMHGVEMFDKYSVCCGEDR